MDAKAAAAAGVARCVRGGRKLRERRNEFAREGGKQLGIVEDWRKCIDTAQLMHEVRMRSTRFHAIVTS